MSQGGDREESVEKVLEGAVRLGHASVVFFYAKYFVSYLRVKQKAS